METQFKITGGTKLHGSVRLGGAKNASYKLLIASLMGNQESRILNFSHISDVKLVSKIMTYLGAKMKKAGERALFINPQALSNYTIEKNHGSQGRFSTMFIPVLLHKFGQAIVPAPGGDKIGARSLDRHFAGLQAMGAKISFKNGLFYAQAKKLMGTNYEFRKNTHTGTETLILAACLAKGKTILKNSAQEPEVDDLIAFLNKMGARIKRTTPRTIEIDGVESLSGAIHALIPDRNEAVSYACAALATKGDVIIENARPDHLKAFLCQVKKAKGGYEVGNYGIRFFWRQPLQATTIKTNIEPGFMTDWQPLWGTLMTQAKGKSVIHETVMSNRFQYTEELAQMGAKIKLFHPKVQNKEKTYNFNLEDDRPTNYHGLEITGPSNLKAGKYKVKDLRHGASLVLAAMISRGVSTITGVEQIERGYENLHERLNSMGALIELIKK